MVDRLDKGGRVIPTIGRIVHYHHEVDRVDYPAIVVEVQDAPDPDAPKRVYVHVFRKRDGMDEHWSSEGTGPGEYSWPPHVVGADLKDIAPSWTNKGVEDAEAQRSQDARGVEGRGAGASGEEPSPGSIGEGAESEADDHQGSKEGNGDVNGASGGE